MSKLLQIALVLVLLAAPASAEALTSLRMSVNEARLHMSAGSWNAAERVLKSLRQQMALDPALDKYRTKVEFVLWDLRMNNHDAAMKDLDALGGLIGVTAPHP